MGAEYVVFVALLENNPAMAWVMGLLALIGGSGLIILHRLRPPYEAAPSWEETVVTWFGEVTTIGVSVALWGGGLLIWSLWHATGAQFFSGLSIVLLIIAIALVAYANYQRKEVTA